MILTLVVVVLVVLGLILSALISMIGLQWYTADGSGIIEAIPDTMETEPAAPTGMLVILSTRLAYTLGSHPDPHSLPTASVVCDRLDQIIETIVESEADIVCVQEADFASHRTHDLDHLYYIASALGWGYVARAVTWECRYVTWPWTPYWKHPLGHVRAGMGVISRYALIQNVRQRLPQSGIVLPLVRRLSSVPMVQMVDVQCGATTLRLLHHDLGRGECTGGTRTTAALESFIRDVYTHTSVLMGGIRDDVLLLSEQFRVVPEADGGATRGRSSGNWAWAFVGEGLSGVETRLVAPAVGTSTEKQIVDPGLVLDQLPVTLRLRWALPLIEPSRLD